MQNWVVEWHCFGALLGCAGLSSTFFRTEKQAPMVFLQKDVETSIKPNPSLWRKVGIYISSPINSPTVATISTPNMFRIQPQNPPVSQGTWTWHRAAAAIGKAWPYKFYTLKKLTAGIEPSNCIWWCGEIYLFPLDHVRFLMSVVPPLQIGQMQEKVSIKPQTQEKNREEFKIWNIHSYEGTNIDSS